MSENQKDLQSKYWSTKGSRNQSQLLPLTILNSIDALRLPNFNLITQYYFQFLIQSVFQSSIEPPFPLLFKDFQT